MNDPIDHTPLLTEIHKLLAMAQENAEVLEMSLNMETPLNVIQQRSLFASTKTTIELQSHLIRNLLEENLMLTDNVEKFVKKALEI